MKLQNLISDEEAVSPVIGVILMVAITVILAAVIGTFVLGLGENVQTTAPQASFSFDYDKGGNGGSGDIMTISHSGGDTIENTNLYVTWSGVASAATVTDTDGDNLGSPRYTWKDAAGSGDPVSAGDSVELKTANDAGDMDAATFRVTWESTQGDNSATLGEWEGPNA